MSEYDVLVLGGVGVDTIVRVPELAVPPGDFLPVPPIRDYVAHSGNGVALGFHALGLRTKLVDFLGDDMLGDDGAGPIRRSWAWTSATSPRPTARRGPSTWSTAGRRFSFFDGRHPHDLVLPPDFYLPHLRARPGTPTSPRRGPRARSPTPAGWASPPPPTCTPGTAGLDWVWPLARAADLVFLSAEAAPERIDDIMLAVLAHGRAHGGRGDRGRGRLPRARPRDTPEVRRFPAVVPERPVIDSNGAGDGFSTAFMSRWLTGAADRGVRAGRVGVGRVRVRRGRHPRGADHRRAACRGRGARRAESAASSGLAAPAAGGATPERRGPAGG